MQTKLRETKQQTAAPPPRKKGSGLVWLFLLPLLAIALWAALQFVPELLPLPVGTQEGGDAFPLPEWVQTAFIPVDGASRRGEKLEELTGIVVHYVGNPGTTARQNRNWYASPESEVSSHFLIGLEGEVILCVPLDEKSSASNQANATTISIEVCHPDETGKFTKASEDRLVELLTYLCRRFELTSDSIIRHYDVTGKICPKYYVEHEDAYLAMKERVRQALLEEAGS